MVKIPKNAVKLTKDSLIGLQDIILVTSKWTTDIEAMQFVKTSATTAQLVFTKSPNRELYSSRYKEVRLPDSGAWKYKLSELYSTVEYYDMYLVDVGWEGNISFRVPENTFEYLRSGAYFTGNDGLNTELFRLTLKDTTSKGTLYTLTRLTDNAVRSFYFNNVTSDAEFSSYVNIHSDEFAEYEFTRLVDPITKEV